MVMRMANAQVLVPGQPAGHNHVAKVPEGGREGQGGKGGAFGPAGPGTGGDDGQPRDGADDDGVDKGAQHGNGPLPGRMIGIGGGMGNGGAAQTCLVGEDATGNAETDGFLDQGASKAAGGGGAGKGAFEAQGQSGGPLCRRSRASSR